MLYLQFIHLYLNRNMQVLTSSYWMSKKKSSSYPGFKLELILITTYKEISSWTTPIHLHLPIS